MRRKKGITLEEHKDLGARLKHIEGMQWAAYMDIAKAYSKSDPQSKAAYKQWELTRKLRSKMDDVIFQDHPGAPTIDADGNNLLNYYMGKQLGTGQYYLPPDDPRLRWDK